jgi:hypothetical protein
MERDRDRDRDMEYTDWGKAAINNNVGWGQAAASNNVGWGISQFLSYSGQTNISGKEQ